MQAHLAVILLESGLARRRAWNRPMDGIRRIAIGELTFEFKNVKQRCCRIKNLLASATAIAALRS